MCTLCRSRNNKYFTCKNTSGQTHAFPAPRISPPSMRLALIPYKSATCHKQSEFKRNYLQIVNKTIKITIITCTRCLTLIKCAQNISTRTAYAIIRIESEIGWNIWERDTVNCCHCTSIFILHHCLGCRWCRKFRNWMSYLPWNQSTSNKYRSIQRSLTIEYCSYWSSQLQWMKKETALKVNKKND